MENQQVKFRGKTKRGRWFGSLINNIFFKEINQIKYVLHY